MCHWFNHITDVRWSSDHVQHLGHQHAEFELDACLGWQPVLLDGSKLVDGLK